MDKVELSPRDKLLQLHDLTPAENRELVEKLENALQSAGQEFSLDYLQAGEINIGNKMIRFSFMLSGERENKNWQEYLSEDLAESIVRSLERIKKSSNDELFVDEIVVTDVNFANPRSGKPVNGVTLTNMENTSQNSIVLFVNALSDTNYRGEIPGVSHLEGTVTHEYGHCLDNASGADLRKMWVERLPWQYDEESDTFSYNGEQQDFVTTYAGVSPTEDLAESYAIYLLDKERLARVSQKRKAFFEALLGS
ncbi:MAG: putative zinc-binding metallopeptidase [Patescibacteria group bacterium]|nr:putative zinc-binding metallopeptidase [Patescibacteria group bacterium]